MKWKNNENVLKSQKVFRRAQEEEAEQEKKNVEEEKEKKTKEVEEKEGEVAKEETEEEKKGKKNAVEEKERTVITVRRVLHPHLLIQFYPLLLSSVFVFLSVSDKNNTRQGCL